MTTMISELYEALINAGATEEKAREAAVALSAENLNSKDNVAEVKTELASDIAELDKKLSGKITELDQRLSGEIAGVKKDLAELDKKMAVMQWMMGATLTGVAAIIVKLFLLPDPLPGRVCPRAGMPAEPNARIVIC